jgi:hypothetical protein
MVSLSNHEGRTIDSHGRLSYGRGMTALRIADSRKSRIASGLEGPRLR